MGDFIRSAFGYFGGPSQSVKENELVGQLVDVGKTQFRIRRVIAEGGFAVVFEGYEHSKGKSFAIKRLLAQDKEMCDAVMREVDIIKRLSGHPNIIGFFGAACVGKEKSRHVGTEFLIVTELCSGGALADFLPTPHQQKPLPLNIVLQILAQTSRAVQHMHKQSPPIIHRDLKVENLLLSEKFTIKLCDFGSASTETYAPTLLWSATERGRTQEALEKVTTPMYRSPEMLDLYLNYPINEAVDIWALGCIIFYLVCGYHPFEDSAKLAILNANFNLPPCDPDFETFHNLIRQMLLVDPTQRPNINSVYGELSDLATTRNVPAFDSIIFNDDVKRRLRIVTKKQDASASQSTRPAQPPPSSTTSNSSQAPPQSRAAPPARPTAPPHLHPPSAHNHRRCHAASGGSSSLEDSGDQPPVDKASGGVLGFLKGSAGHLIKNIRETSVRVMEAVTAAIPTDLDLQYITSRIAVMSYPAESGLEVFGSRNSMEEAQSYLDRHHPGSYAVYNLSPRSYRSSHWFGGRVSFRPFEAHRAPTLWSLVELCQNARLWLSQKPNNVCVVHCTDGRQLSAVLVCCLLCFCRVFSEASSAVKFFISKRGPVHLTPAQMRYIDYVAKLVAVPPHLPHNHPIGLLSIILSPIPTFNRLKNGCRPFVEIYQGGKKVFSSMTDYESLRTYELEDRKMEIILNGLSVYGDVTIAVYHARSFFAGKGKASSVKICQIQFHTGFIGQEVEKVSFMKCELDHLHSAGPSGANAPQATAAPPTSRYAESFHATLHLTVSPNERPRGASSLVFPWETLPSEGARKPMLCFSDAFEMRGVMSPAALRNAGYSESGHPLRAAGSPDRTGQSPQPPSPESVANSHQEVSEEEEEGERPPSLDPSAPTATLIEGLDWNQAPKTHIDPEFPSSPAAVPQNASTTLPANGDSSVGDLLGFASATTAPGCSTVASEEAGSVNPTAPLLEDIFESAVPSTGVEPASWHDPWGGSANLNPFDPLGTATEPPENGSAVSAEFDPFLGRTAPMHFSKHTSSSTSNLSSACRGAAGTPSVHTSASSSNLTQNSNPFQVFDEFFEAAAASAKAGSSTTSPTHQPSSTNATPSNFGFAYSPNTAPRRPAFGSQAQASTPTHGSNSCASPRHSQPPQSQPPPPPPPPPSASQGARPWLNEDAFEDLLGDFGAPGQSFGSKQNRTPRTLAEIRHQKLAETEDPEAMKIIQWLDGKERNVRALLCTLNSVLWEGVRWEQISMADVMTVKQVKQQYRKAARAVHPDKWMNTQYVNMAKLILVELNDAMAEFERQEQ
uniref:Cyclin-G-associated kinase n=2 Tax=Mesocestoides corti TaxID=53468 RepID=A0A5K3F440_MESCO